MTHPATDPAWLGAMLSADLGRTQVEAQLADAGFEPLADVLGALRQDGLASIEASVDPVLQVLQWQLNVPLLFLLTVALVQLAKMRGWQRILLSGRDCYLWSLLCDSLRPVWPGLPSTVYFYTSRVARAHPSAEYLAYFNHLCGGAPAVVVDLCGTGWSLRRLIQQSAAPDTGIFLFHHLILPGLSRRYEELGMASAQAPLHALLARPPIGHDSDVLEDLNRAPHRMTVDVRRDAAGGFQPHDLALEAGPDALAMQRAMQVLFSAACARLAQLSPAALADMGARDPMAALKQIYARYAGLAPALMPLLVDKAQEERLVWQLLQAS